MTLDSLEFLAAFLPGRARRLTRTGVQIHCLQYWSDALEPWIGQKKTVWLHYDPRDITVVFVRTPGGVLVRATVTTPNVPAISLAEWGMRCMWQRGRARDPELVEMRDASKKRSLDLVEKAKKSRKLKRRLATAAAGDACRGTSAPTASTPDPERGDQVTTNPAELSAIRTYFDVEGYDDDE